MPKNTPFFKKSNKILTVLPFFSDLLIELTYYLGASYKKELFKPFFGFGWIETAKG
jgi:hypothetical protein